MTPGSRDSRRVTLLVWQTEERRKGTGSSVRQGRRTSGMAQHLEPRAKTSHQRLGFAGLCGLKTRKVVGKEVFGNTHWLAWK